MPVCVRYFAIMMIGGAMMRLSWDRTQTISDKN
jgi:hypothetical protein